MGFAQWSGPLLTSFTSCLPGLQLRHGLLAQEWTTRHEQGPQPATHRPAPQRHWSVPPQIPLAAQSVPCLHASVPWQTEGFPVSFSSPGLWKVLIIGWREEGREGRVRTLWFGANRKDLSKHFRRDWNIGFERLTGGLRFKVLSPIPPAQCLQGCGHMSAYPPPCGAGGGCLILFQVCGH